MYTTVRYIILIMEEERIWHRYECYSYIAQLNVNEHIEPILLSACLK